ncbi:MAG TPA: FmdB family transcriptional regulator [Lachnospiraceae bacterium]|nr:FmdB family transcriptional regulator [Lachnospiraceae bacterium]
MPFYDLKCVKCNKEFNIMASMKEKEANTIKCPTCGSNELNTVFKSVNVIKSKENSHSCSGGCCGCPHA